MRIFISSLIQETNTFSPIKSDLSLFNHGYVYHGSEIPWNLKGTNTEIGGLIDYFNDSDCELIWGSAYWAVAAGCMTNDAYEFISNDIIRRISNAGKLDGVILVLHGALVAENEDDCEGTLLARVREVIGFDTPLVITLDYHANVTQKMADMADACVGYRTYPHVDFALTGIRGAKALKKLIYSKEKPSCIFKKIPMIVPVENSETGFGLCKEIMDHIIEIEATQDSILSASFFCTQPWLDVDEMGLSIIVFYLPALKREDLLDKKLEDLRNLVIEKKDSLLREFNPIDKVLQQIDSYKKPMIIVDSGDITTAGGVGDSTVMLRAMLSYQGFSALTIVCPKAVESAFSIGDGGKGRIVIGDGLPGKYNESIEVQAEVIKTSVKKSIVSGKSFSGISADGGKRALLKIDNHVYVIVVEYSTLMFDPQFFREMGVEPKEMDVIIQKSHKLFRSAYHDIAKEVVIVDSPGVTTMNITELSFEKVKKNIFPFCREGDEKGE